MKIFDIELCYDLQKNIISEIGLYLINFNKNVYWKYNNCRFYKCKYKKSMYKGAFLELYNNTDKYKIK